MIDKTKYISIFPTTRKHEAEAWAKKRFVEGTYVIEFYEPSKYYHVYVLRAEVRYWLETTTESVCGNCSYLEEKNYTDGTQVQLCNLQRKNAYGISITRCTSLGRTCEEHQEKEIVK